MTFDAGTHVAPRLVVYDKDDVEVGGWRQLGNKVKVSNSTPQSRPTSAEQRVIPGAPAS